MGPLRVEIIESDLLAQNMLLLLVAKSPDIRVVWVGAPEERLKLTGEEVDVSYLGFSATEHDLLPQLIEHCKATAMVMVCENHTPQTISLGLKYGVSSYLQRDEFSLNIVPILRTVAQGASVLTRTPAQLVLESAKSPGLIRPVITALPSPISQLKDSERTNLYYIYYGFSKEEIADELCISVNTVASRLRSAYVNAGVTSRAHAYAELTKGDLL